MHGMLFWNGWRFARQGYSDFTIFYTAGKIVRMGLGGRLYDDALQFQLQQSFASGVQNRKGPLPYNHPAFEALVFVPFTGLDYSSALVAWDLLGLAILGALPFILRPHISLLGRASPLVWFLVLLAFLPVLATLSQGQDAVLLLLLYTLAFVALKKNNDILAGCCLGMGTFRFHLIVPLVLILLFWRRTKAVQSFLVTTGILAGVSVLITGWAEAIRYPKYVLHLERITGGGGIFPSVMPNMRGLLQGWPTAREFPFAVQVMVIALSVGILAWVIVAGRSQQNLDHQFDLQFSLATVATVLVSYHAYAYDLIILVIPALLLVSHASEPGRLRWSGNLALLLPAGLLFCTPLYILLGVRWDHLNLLAVVLLVWLWGIRKEITSKLRPREI